MIKYIKNINYEYLAIIFLILFDIAIYFTNTNSYLFYKLNTIHIYLPDLLMRFFNYVANSHKYVLIVVLLLVTVIFKPKQTGRVVLMIALYYIIVNFLKTYFHVARPYMILNPDTFYFLNENYNYIQDGYHSFPSGHTSFISLFIFAINRLFFNNKPYIKYLLILFIPLVAIIRIASGYHWPIDVITGIILSYFIVKLSFINYADK